MQKQISILLSTLFIFSSIITPNLAQAATAVLPGFDPNKIIDDRVFSNNNAMGSANAVQKFLEGKGSVLANTSADFIAKLKEPTNSSVKQTVEDPQPNLNRNRTAAELIWDAAQASGINPQVLIVTLNKEQSLITGRQGATPEQMQRALDFAMGFGCPDSQPCGELYRGFYFQLFGNVDSENNRYLGAAKSLMKSFSTPGGRGPAFNGTISKVGDVITLQNTTGDYEGVMPNQSIKIGNAATAALYRYTPHVFNGNYNFWRFFKTWFDGGTAGSGDTLQNGELVKKGNTLYMIENGKKYKVLSFVADARKLDEDDAEKISSKEFDKYQSGGYLSPADNTVIELDDKYYVFIGGVKRPASEFVLKQRGLNPKKAFNADEDEARLFTTGDMLLPNEGTVLRGESGTDTYLVEGNTLKKFTVQTLAEYNAESQVVKVPDVELSTYPKNGTVTPKPVATPAPTPAPTAVRLVKGSKPAVYAIENGKKTLLTYEMFTSRGYKFTDVATITDGELNGYADAGAATPTPSTTKLVKGSTPAVYLVENGKKTLLDYQTFVNRGFKFSDVATIADTELNSYPGTVASAQDPKPAATPPANMTYFTNKKTGEFWVYMNGGKHLISPFVAKQKKMTPDVAYEDDYVQSLATSTPIIPRDGTILKGTKPDVYVITGGVARPLTAVAFKARGITSAQIVVLPQPEVDGYVKGPVLNN